jgi:hypothetical protein
MYTSSQNDDLNILELSDDEGAFYSIYEYFDDQNRKCLSIHIMSPDKKFETFISYFHNGKINSICQRETESYNPRLLGINAQYKIDGTVMQEVNLEEEFKLTEDSIYSILTNNKLCTNMQGFWVEEFDRRLITNYGKLWIVNFKCYDDCKQAVIIDSTSEIYTGEYEYYSSEEYKIKYGVQDYLDIEKKINKKIIIYNKLLCE